MLTCRELVELVTEYVDDALPPDGYAVVVAHLKECQDCLRYLAQLQATRRVVATVPSTTLTPEQRAVAVRAFREWCAAGSAPAGVGRRRWRRVTGRG